MIDHLRIEIPKHLPRLLKYAQHFEYAIAEDLVNTTIERALNNADKFAPGTNLAAWLFTILRNVYLNECRRRNYRVLYSWDDERDFEPVAAENPERALIIKELFEMIATLPAESRILIYRMIENQSYEEIAKEFGVPIGTVKSRLSRLRLRLRENI
jgi:RNA polymerase sigma-70 factor (ECF subfamily)